MQQNPKAPLSQKNEAEEEEDYQSILDDDEEDEPEEILSYEETISHGHTHHFDHSDQIDPDEE